MMKRHPDSYWTRRRIQSLSRVLTCAVVAGSLGTLFWNPQGPFSYLLDVLLRTYLMFLGTVMAHEAVHGHMGASRSSNFRWGRFALLPTLVPYTNFRKTHQLHHLHTNVPGCDPDLFMKPRRSWEIPFRALAMPHSWFFWLRKRGRLKTPDLRELVANYLGIALVYGLLWSQIGLWRLVLGIGPALVLVSVLLWYPFAIKTHEGFSTGAAESRSHDYYGKSMYWLSLGLSMHREHHLQPRLSWLELGRYVKSAPSGEGFRFWPRRDIRQDKEAA